MADGSYYVERAVDLTTGGHTLSHELDSFRSYSWEVHIPKFPGLFSNIPGLDNQERLTLACKQITQPGFTVEDIEVHRVNEKFFYPGKPNPEEITLTFDNLVKGDVAKALFSWMRTVYDPVYGVHYGGLGGSLSPDSAELNDTVTFKRPITIYQLDAHRNPRSHINLYGAYPKGFKLGEFNYESNTFHTIEMTLRYDFLVHYSDEEDLVPAELDPTILA